MSSVQKVGTWNRHTRTGAVLFGMFSEPVLPVRQRVCSPVVAVSPMSQPECAGVTGRCQSGAWTLSLLTPSGAGVNAAVSGLLVIGREMIGAVPALTFWTACPV